MIPLNPKNPKTAATHEILIIPFDYSDWRHDEPLRENVNPHLEPASIENTEKLFNVEVRNYIRLISRNRADIRFHIFPEWIKAGELNRKIDWQETKPEEMSMVTAREIVEKSYSDRRNSYSKFKKLQDYHVVIFLSAAPSRASEEEERWEDTIWTPGFHFVTPETRIDTAKKRKAIMLSAHDRAGVICHELCHALYDLADKCFRQSWFAVYRYQLMGGGSWNGVDPKEPEKVQSDYSLKNSMPPLVSPWNRVNLGWERHPAVHTPDDGRKKYLMAPAHDAEKVSDEKYTNLLTVRASADQYYILENRPRPRIEPGSPVGPDKWDIALPTWGIVVWLITDRYRKNRSADSGYENGLWEAVLNTHSPQRPGLDYKYTYLDSNWAATEIDKVCLALYDAPLKEGECFRLPGTGLTLKFEKLLENLVAEISVG